MRRAALLAVVVVVAGCGGGKHATSVADVQRTFAAHGQRLVQRAIPLFGLERRQIAPHVQAFLNNGDLFVWVFDAEGSARDAQRALPALADRRPAASGFSHRQGNVIALGETSRWPAVRAAFAELR